MTPIHFSILLFMIGLYGVINKNNLIKKIIGLTIINGSTVLFFICIGYKESGLAPIFDKGGTEDIVPVMVNPVPQALMLTAIVIGVSVTALALGLIVKIYEKYKSLDIQQFPKEQ